MGALASGTTGILSFVCGIVALRMLPALGPSDGLAQALRTTKGKIAANFRIPEPPSDVIGTAEISTIRREAICEPNK